MPDHLGGATEDDGSRPPTLDAVLLDENSVEDLLDLVVALAGRTVDGVDGVSVSLRHDGRMLTGNASDDVVRELDSVQYRTNMGPCVEAMQTGDAVNLSLGDEPERYPEFGTAAVQRFMTAVISTPLWVQDRSIGALNLYSASIDRFNEAQVELASLFSRQAAIVLSNAVAYAAAESLNEQLQTALITRETIGQAKGILMERQGCSAEEAFDLLRERSQHQNTKLRVVAEDVVASVPRK